MAVAVLRRFIVALTASDCNVWCSHECVRRPIFRGAVGFEGRQGAAKRMTIKWFRDLKLGARSFASLSGKTRV